MNVTAAPSSERGSAADEPILEAVNVTLGYGKHAVLHDVDMRIHAGQFWFLVGTNGQGKTTLLAALLGTLRPLAGRIDRRDDFTLHERIGFVPQRCGLNPTMPTTVREFVLSGLVGVRADRRQRRARLAEALKRLDLTDRERHGFWSLSGGQQQRALVARALIRRPRILIADEPTAGMDASVETSLLATLHEMHRNDGLTLIVVTHDLRVAARYGTHAALVHRGRVDAGPVRRVLTEENLRRTYGAGIVPGLPFPNSSNPPPGAIEGSA